MALEIGGRSDKDGNEFERLWVAHLALEVVAGRAQSLQWEPPLHEVEGGELVLIRNGSHELHQCKLGNASDGRWTVSELRSRGVLSHASLWLSGGHDREFHFVSRHPAASLEGLSNRARRAIGSDLGALSTNDQKEFSRLLESWSFSPALEGDTSHALDLLKRLHFSRGFWDSDISQLEFQAESEFVGSGTEVIAALTAILYERLGQPVHADQLRQSLAAAGYLPRDLRHDERVAAAVERLQNEFLTDLTRPLIGGEMIPRDCARAVIESIVAPSPPGVILLSGAAGAGKSGVVLQVCRELRALEVPFLPVRLDLERPDSELVAFSTSKLGLDGDPVSCLEAVAGERATVLVIDQLDAIHWTGAHSEKALQVVRELLTRARRVESMTVLVACRSFDLEDDKRLRGLFPSTPLTIEVGDLPEAAVAAVLKSQGVDARDLPSKTRNQLRNAFMLSLWVQVAQRSGASPSFGSRASLLDMFWDQQRRSLRNEWGLSDAEVSASLDGLVAYLDRERRLDAPEVLFQGHAARALLSLGLIQRQRGRVRFSHQAHADYLIARRVVTQELAYRATLLKWVKADQSLFRREQVRQVLQVLRDVEPINYLDALSELILSPTIRFHLCQLAVQTLRQLDDPLPDEVALVARALERGELTRYLCDHLLLHSPVWTQAILERGPLRLWLGGSETPLRNLALRVLGSCAMQLGDEIATTVVPILRNSEAPASALAQLLPADFDSDSPLLFEERLALARTYPHLAFRLSNLVRIPRTRTEPLRRLRLLRALLEGALDRYDASPNELRAILPDLTSDERSKAFSAAFSACPQEACDLLIPTLARVIEVVTPPGKGAIPYPWTQLIDSLSEGLGFAGATLARSSAGTAMHLVGHPVSSTYGDRIVARVLMALEPDTFAADAIEWLTADEHRLSASWRTGDDPGWLAADLVRRFAVACSDVAYARLEQAILSVRNPEEFLSVKDQLALIRQRPPACDPLVWGDGRCRNEYGLLQHVLLSALPPGRRSPSSSRLADAWLRKFGEASPPVAVEGMGGCVGSSIPRRYLMRIPDQQWLRIAAGTWAKRPGCNLRQVSPSQLSERSHEAFSADFGEATRRDPVRFAKLALRLGGAAAPAYARSALWALGRAERPEDAVAHWTSAPISALELLVERLEALGPAGPEPARAFCFAAHRRPSEAGSDSAIDRLAGYVESALDPAPLAVPAGISTDGWAGAENLEHLALNSVRGAAVHALVAIRVAGHPLHARRILRVLRSASRDPHAAVRIAVQAAAGTLLQGNPDDAVSLFLAASDHENDAVLGSSEARAFLVQAWRDHRQVLERLYCRMVASNVPACAELGAECVTAVFLIDGRLEDWFRVCRSGHVAQRRGAARAAVTVSSNDEHADVALQTLITFFSDQDPGVRKAAGRVFSRRGFLDRTPSSRTALEFASSEAFLGNPDALIGPLAEDLARAAKFGEAIGEAARRLGEVPKDGFPWDLESNLTNLILAVYDRTNDSKVRERCLDALDSLLRASSPRIHGFLDRLDALA